MLAIDETELKKVVTALNEKDASLKLEPDNAARLLHRMASRRASTALFKDFFERSGLKTAELDKLLQNHRAEMKAFIKKQEAEAKSLVASNNVALSDALHSRSNALKILTGPFIPRRELRDLGQAILNMAVAAPAIGYLHQLPYQSRRKIILRYMSIKRIGTTIQSLNFIFCGPMRAAPTLGHSLMLEPHSSSMDFAS